MVLSHPVNAPVGMMLVLGYLPLVVLGQFTFLTSATTPTATATSAAPAYTGTPTLLFATIPTLTACSTMRLNWRLANEDPSNYNLLIQVVNGDLDQTIPGLASSSASTSAVATTTTVAAVAESTSVATSSLPTVSLLSFSYVNPFLPTQSPISTTTAAVDSRFGRRTVSINATIANTPANVGYTWNVNVPQGRYVLVGTVSDAFGTTSTSNTFSVIQGSDTSCLAAYQSSSSSASASASGSSSSKAGTSSGSAKPASTLSSNDSSSTSGGSGVPTGAIVGAVIGVLAGLGLLALLAFCLIKRRRRDQQRRADHDGFGSGAMMAEMKDRRPDSGGNPFVGGTRDHSPTTTPAASHDGHLSAPISLAHSQPGTAILQPQYQREIAGGASAAGAAGAAVYHGVGSIHSMVPDSVGRISGSRRNSGESYLTAPMSHSHDHSQGHQDYIYPGTPGTFGSSRRDPFATPMETPLDEGENAQTFVPDPTASSAQDDFEVLLSEKAARRISTPLFGTTEPTARAIKRSSLQTPNTQGNARTYGDLGLSGVEHSSPTSTASGGDGGTISRRPSDFSAASGITSQQAAPVPGSSQRKGSMRRIPVPSLGPELRGQMAAAGDSHNGGRSGSATPPSKRNSVQQQPGKKQEFSLIPDMPIQHP